MRSRLNFLTLFFFFITTTFLAQQTKAPNFSLKTSDGKTIELSKFKGKAVVLNFWATWCPPCKQEIPDLIQVYKKYKERGLIIIGISIDQEGWDIVKPFIKETKIPYPVVLGNQDVVQDYGNFDGIPATFFIDSNGIIIDHQIGMLTKEIFETKVKAILPKAKETQKPKKN
ncbi:MAG: TlpA disulfide reductase family protein [Bacteroidota bacterium]